MDAISLVYQACGFAISLIGSLTAIFIVGAYAGKLVNDRFTGRSLHSPPGETNEHYKRGYTEGLLRAGTIVRALTRDVTRPSGSEGLLMLAKSIEADTIGSGEWPAKFWRLIQRDTIIRDASAMVASDATPSA